jgi:cell division septal protein FtsQ
MKKRIAIGFALLILLSTITSQQKIVISTFNLKEIKIENNFLLKDKDIKRLLIPIYGKNLIFLKYTEIEKALMQNSYIESFNIKKKYPHTLKIKIFEKKPIAVLINKNKRFYLSEKIDLIKFDDLKSYQNLPLVFGNREKFKIFYEDLKKINFPLKLITKYTLYKSNRWDLETINKKMIKLSSNNYTKNLKHYLDLRDQDNFKKYKVFDYRIRNQIILK